MIRKVDKLGFRALLKFDLARLGAVSFCSFLQHYFVPRGDSFPYVFWLRVEQCLRSGGWLKRFWGAIVYLIYRHYEFKYGIHANPNIEIGPGLLVVHGEGVHLNCERIGRNLTVYQGVTLGIQAGKRPIVEDDVTIYPNAVIVGGVRLGKGCVVGALSYVSHDVPDGVTVVGAPAHVISSKS